MDNDKLHKPQWGNHNNLIVNRSAWSPAFVGQEPHFLYASSVRFFLLLTASSTAQNRGYMADQGKWFKLWVSALNDPHLDNLDIADFGRWAKFGAYLKEQGTDGEIVLSYPSRTLVAKLQLPDFNSMIMCIQKFPNISVSSETNESVSFKVKCNNWLKYQGDWSTNRVHKFREKNALLKRSKKRREEKRKEEKRKEEKKKYGEYKNVLLSDEEYQKLQERFNSDSAKWIKTLDEGIQYKGYKYKSHYLAILKWAENEQTKRSEYL